MVKLHKDLVDVLVKEKAVLILGRLYGESCALKDLSEETGYGYKNIKRRVDELMKIGLVNLDPEFRHAKVYKLTPLGAGLVKQYLFDFYMLTKRLRRMLKSHHRS